MLFSFLPNLNIASQSLFLTYSANSSSVEQKKTCLLQVLQNLCLPFEALGIIDSQSTLQIKEKLQFLGATGGLFLLNMFNKKKLSGCF